MKKLFVLFTIVMLLGIMGWAQTVDEIIAKNLAAKGGAEKIRAIKTTKTTGKMLMMNVETATTMWYKEPNMFRMELLISDKKITFAYDGTVAWQISPFSGSEEPQEMTGQQAEQIKDNADMFGDPFVDYQKKGFSIALEGKEDMEGTPVFKLKLTKKDGKVIYYFIDAENYIELKTQITRTIGEGQEMNLETFFGDFKEVLGIMVPHSLHIKMNGQDFGNIVVESQEMNVQLDDAFFKLPPKKAEEPKKIEEPPKAPGK